VRAGTDEVKLDGVGLVVPSPGVPGDLAALVESRNRGIEVASEIDLAYRISASPIIAVTGTNGKTTTTALIGSILEADGRDVQVAGNISADELKLPLITAARRSTERGVIAAEISSFQLEHINTFRPRVGLLLNVHEDHQKRYADSGDYARAKARLFENQTEADFAVLNGDNPPSASLEPHLKARVLKFTLKSDVDEGAFVRGDELIVRLAESETVVCMRSDIRLRGDCNLENVLAAACATVAFGVEPSSVRQAVREFVPVPHRLEPVAVIDGVEYVNNSMCTNVVAAASSVEAISEPQIVIAGGKAEASDFAAFGKALRNRAKHLILIGADADLIERSAREAGMDRITRAQSMQDAVGIARRLAEPGDVVVLTPGCKSFDMFSSFEERGRVFREIVKDYEREGSGRK